MSARIPRGGGAAAETLAAKPKAPLRLGPRLPTPRRRRTASPRGSKLGAVRGTRRRPQARAPGGAIARVSPRLLGPRASNVGPTPSRQGKTDVRPSDPAEGVGKDTRSAQILRTGTRRREQMELSCLEVAGRPLARTPPQERDREHADHRHSLPSMMLFSAAQHPTRSRTARSGTWPLARVPSVELLSLRLRKSTLAATELRLSAPCRPRRR